MCSCMQNIHSRTHAHSVPRCHVEVVLLLGQGCSVRGSVWEHKHCVFIRTTAAGHVCTSCHHPNFPLSFRGDSPSRPSEDAEPAVRNPHNPENPIDYGAVSVLFVILTACIVLYPGSCCCTVWADISSIFNPAEATRGSRWVS